MSNLNALIGRLAGGIRATVAVIGMGCLMAGAAWAQSTDIWTTDFQKAFMTEPMMHKMDMSGKGMVTRQDYDRYMGEVFDRMDKKHTGMVDEKAWTTMDTGSTNIWTTDFQKAFRSPEMMHTMDAGKGMVSRQDFMNHMGMIFDRLDKDHNGMLEKDEFLYEKAFLNR